MKKMKDRKKRNFTLIELLIVVAIIAILASLLLPALSAALNKSKAITCLSGMKQLNLAVQNYLDNNKDTIVTMTSDWEHPYYSASSEGYMNLSQIPRDAAGLNNRVCKKDTGVCAWVPRKNICSLVADARQKGNANDPTRPSVSLCSASESSCSGHLQYFYFYGMLFGGNGRTLSNGSYNYHKLSRLRQPSGSMFWAEGSNQVQKTVGLGDLSQATLGFWQHANRTNVLFFDGHAASVGTSQTVCAHTSTSETIKTCPSCRFWAPYLK